MAVPNTYTFYKGDRVVRGVHPIDASPYFAEGWATEPVVNCPMPAEVVKPVEPVAEVVEVESPPSDRATELQQIFDAQGWRAIRDIAIPLGIEKPEGGWDDAIPLIVQRESALA